MVRQIFVDEDATRFLPDSGLQDGITALVRFKLHEEVFVRPDECDAPVLCARSSGSFSVAEKVFLTTAKFRPPLPPLCSLMRFSKHFIDSSSVLSQSQYGFRSSMSSSHALIDLVE